MKYGLFVAALTPLLLTASANTDPAQANQVAGGEQSPKPLLTLVGPHKQVNWMAFSPDGARLATASGGQAVLWDATTGRKLRTLGEESAPLYGPLQFFPESRCLAGVGPENKIDWKGYVAACYEVGGTDWFSIEQEDYPEGKSPMQCTRASLEGFKAILKSAGR